MSVFNKLQEGTQGLFATPWRRNRESQEKPLAERDNPPAELPQKPPAGMRWFQPKAPDLQAFPNGNLVDEQAQSKPRGNWLPSPFSRARAIEPPSWSADPFLSLEQRPATLLPPPRPLRQMVAVIDDFLSKSVDVDGDEISDLTHGEAVSTYLQKQLPEAEILKLQFPFINQGGHPLAEAVESDRQFGQILDALIAMKNSGQPLSGVNLSLLTLDFERSTPHPIAYRRADLAGLADAVGLPITSENVESLRPQIRERLAALYQQPAPDHTLRQGMYASSWPVIQKLEALAEQGVKVSVSAGNGPEEFNLYGLANGVETVGALDPEGAPVPIFANHAMVRRFAQGIYESRPMKAYGKVMGFDMTGDGQINVPFSQTSLRQFIGKPVDAVLIPSPEAATLMEAKQSGQLSPQQRERLQRGLVDMGTYAQAMGWDPEVTPLLRKDYGDVVHPLAGMAFWVSPDQTVELSDYIAPKAVPVTGTSFAAPTHLGKALQD